MPIFKLTIRTLTEGGTVAGKVMDVNGLPLKGVDVEVFDPVTWSEVADSETNESGEYQVGGLPVDSYSLRFEKKGYVVQWYADKTRREDADRFDIVDTSTHSGYDVALKKGVQLSGVVTDSTGFPLSNTEVGIYGDIDDEPFDEVHTTFDGTYTFRSARGPTALASSHCSGARYPGVPRSWPVMV